MNEDIKLAKANLDRAVAELIAISQLPTNRGDRVLWPHNGLIWMRLGEDQWTQNDNNYNHKEPYSSRYIASQIFVRTHEI